MNKLFWLIIIPFIASFFLFIAPNIEGGRKKSLAIALSLIPFFLLLFFSPDNWMGDMIKYPWLPSLQIEFYFEMDSLSFLFIYLTSIIIPISLFAVNDEKLSFPNTFYGLVLLLQGLLNGFFTAGDLVLFLIFWEAMLFPLFFIITLWGKSFRRVAALKFLIYMIAGSSLMVAGVLALYFASTLQGNGTFNIAQLATISSQMPHVQWICMIFVLAFSVKTPLFPFHAWLPDAYYEAPTSGTILLSSLLSKAGIYGFLRIGLGLFPEQIRDWSPLLLGLSIAGVLYGGLAAWMQNDYKRLIAYSSFSHVNFILAGIFIFEPFAHEGAVLQAINHGITIAGLFLVAGWLEERIGSTRMSYFGGLAQYLPHLCWLTMIFVLSSVALPGTNNFIGELLILFGLFGVSPWLAFLLGLSVILSVIYMLRWMQNLYFETPKDDYSHPSQYKDIGVRELFIALPLVVLIFWIGIYPNPVLKQLGFAIDLIGTHLMQNGLHLD